MMKTKFCPMLGASLLAVAAAAPSAGSSSAHPTYYPYLRGTRPLDPNRPLMHAGPYEAPYLAPGKSKSGTWADVSTTLPFSHGPWGPMLMTDGTVLVLDYCSDPGQWYRLTPDNKGKYTDGSWTAVAPMPSGYSPLYFAQQVLANGNAIMNGGEYNVCNGDWTNKGAMFDNATNTWTSVSPPTGWTSIGDAESIVLPSGTYMLADCCDDPSEQALASISGTTVNWTTSQACSDTCLSNAGFTALPDGDVFLVEGANSGNNNYWVYDTSTGTWSLVGETADYVGFDMGPAPLTPEGPKGGTIIQFTGAASPGVNDVYSVANGKWTSGPVMSVGNVTYVSAGGPAATLPDGNILVQASPGLTETPSHFWEFAINKKGKAVATQVNDPKEAPETSPFESNLLVLPTGEVLWDNSQVSPSEVAVYTPKGKPRSSWLPHVSSVSATLTVGSTGNAISGTNFNGWDLGGAQGFTAQEATNFPLVRVTNTKSGDVCFGRSYNFATMGVWTRGTTNAEFDIPASCETGASTLQVIVNGVASKGVSVTLKG